MAMEAHRIIVCWCMGLTQHKNAVATIQDVMNFLLLRGNIGRPGAGPCPVRGHSNVQGDRTMGIWDKPKEEFLEKLGKEFLFQPPREHGFDVVEALKAMHEGRAKVLLRHGRQLALGALRHPVRRRGRPQVPPDGATSPSSSTARTSSRAGRRSSSRAWGAPRSTARRPGSSS